MDVEQKINLLESEVGLMKGEIKQTLVDLRDFVMRQDSPLARRGSGPASAAQEEQVRRVTEQLEELRRQVSAARAAQSASVASQASVPMAAAPSQAVTAGASPIAGPTVHVIQTGTGQAATAPAATGAAESQPGAAQGVQQAQKTAPAEADREATRPQPRKPLGQRDSRERTAAPEERSARRPLPSVRYGPRPSRWTEEEPEERAQARPASRPTQRPAATSRSMGGAMRSIRRPMGRPYRPIPGQYPDPYEQPGGYWTRPPAVESWEEGGPYPTPYEEMAFPGVLLDANLVVGLMRWVGNVKCRLGTRQLAAFVEIYKMTGQLPPPVERVLARMAEMESLPDESSDHVFTLDDMVDSLMQLHAIIHGPGTPEEPPADSEEEGSPEEGESEEQAW